MTIKEQLDLITPQILPQGHDFFEQQKGAIVTDKSVNIVAGPGSGKTTVLIAKCALLLKRSSNSNKGICLITHTNIAVDEIRIGLKKIGINSIEYPNFIGTIQEFFNSFFSRKAFHLIHKEKIFRVLDDEEYKEKFDGFFQQFKPNWYTYSTPNIIKGRPKILISDDLTYSINSAANSSYKEAFEKSIKQLFDRGFVNNQQCLELAYWYITKQEEPIKKAIVNRFEYVLLDEAQDTSPLQYKMLQKLFADSKVIFQKFGDPYQALYNLYEGNEDAWVPYQETTDTYYQEISETSRFGSTIADIVKNVCIEKYDTFRSLDLVKSFNPVYIIYDSETDLLNQYQGLIGWCESESESFLSSDKKDAILSVFHENLESLFKNYTRTSTKPRKNDSQVRKTYNFLLNLLSKELDISFNELKDKIDLHLDCKVVISKCIKEIVNESFLMDSFIKYLKEVLIILSKNTQSQFVKTNLERQVTYFRQNILFSELNNLIEKSYDFDIGTIHSAKGETHRSTLLVLDALFKDFSHDVEFSMFDLLKEYLVGNYIDVQTITNEIEKNETIKSLKLAYVALSRPTHLMVIAIPQHLIVADNHIIERLNNNGWIQYTKLSIP